MNSKFSASQTHCNVFFGDDSPVPFEKFKDICLDRVEIPHEFPKALVSIVTNGYDEQKCLELERLGKFGMLVGLALRYLKRFRIDHSAIIGLITTDFYPRTENNPGFNILRSIATTAIRETVSLNKSEYVESLKEWGKKTKEHSYRIMVELADLSPSDVDPEEFSKAFFQEHHSGSSEREVDYLWASFNQLRVDKGDQYLDDFLNRYIREARNDAFTYSKREFKLMLLAIAKLAILGKVDEESAGALVESFAMSMESKKGFGDVFVEIEKFVDKVPPGLIQQCFDLVGRTTSDVRIASTVKVFTKP